MISYGNSLVCSWLVAEKKPLFTFKFLLFFYLKKKILLEFVSALQQSVPSVSKTLHPFCKSTGHGINVIIIIRKEPNLWALCTSHAVGNNEKAGETFAASRLSNSFSNSLAQLNLCKVQPFWCIKTSVIIFKVLRTPEYLDIL